MKKIVNLVTITGADDSVHPFDLASLSFKYPFVEWGILLSRSNMGTVRFPSENWLKELFEIYERMKFSAQSNKTPSFRLCGHLCGKWVREVCEGNWCWIDELDNVESMFDRIQLNFHAYVHNIETKLSFLEGFKDVRNRNRKFIFQLDDVNNGILDIVQKAGIPASPLFDTSGGIGRLPEKWPVARKGWCGYAGGLSPENLKEQMEKITEVAGEGPIWIDVETRVRSEDDSKFILSRVEDFLQAAEPWVIDTERKSNYVCMSDC